MDIVDVNKNKIYTLYWALLRFYYMKKIAQDQIVNEEKIRKWANKFDKS